MRYDRCRTFLTQVERVAGARRCEEVVSRCEKEVYWSQRGWVSGGAICRLGWSDEV